MIATENELEAAADRFWRHAVALYGAPGVQEACLRLQDKHGADVNLLLYGAYSGAVLGQRLDEVAWRALIDGTEDWRAGIVRPLRAVRRRAKALTADMPHLAFAYEALKRCEIETERAEHRLLLELDAAEGPAADGESPEVLAAANMRACLLAQGVEVEAPDVAGALRLISRLAPAPAADSKSDR
ncbi:MAG: TIGR02444 family protein [Alphaproteobacteria bacterium]|nr:MAG: TIGR02444 family protein [Alphaproteobacteria bacterium]